MPPSPSPPSKPGSPPGLPDDLRYIAIEGVIGVGKTTLARILAERFGGKLVLEKVEENPFLPRFYEDPDRWGFHTQLSYLASRFQQQKALEERDLFQQLVVSDYTFDKDRIFATINLRGDELQLYETLYGMMAGTIPQPDLIVYLRSSIDRLLRNIARRDRPYERDIDPAYLALLADAYDFHFSRHRRGSVLVVNADEMDFVTYASDRDALIARIVQPDRSGVRVLNPVRPPDVPLQDSPSPDAE